MGPLILADSSAWIEYLRGTGSATHLQLRELVRDGARSQPPLDYEAGARIYRTCRRGGETVRAPVDCVIAAIAMRCRAAILTKDRDFATIARHVELELA
jgi:predicted nucleic acid-binding protein